MGNVIDDISNNEFLRTSVILGATIGANIILPGSGAFVGLGLSALLQPDIDNLKINQQYNGLKSNTIDNVSPRKIIYGQRTVGGQVFHRNTTSTVDYEDIDQDQVNEYLHQFITLTGHECQSVEEYFISNSPVTIDVNNMVTDNKFRAKITRGGMDITTQIVMNSDTWIVTETKVYNNARFELNNGIIFVKGLDPNKTFNLSGQKITIEGISELDINYTVYMINYLATNHPNLSAYYTTIRDSHLNYGYISNADVNTPYEFTIQSSFSSDNTGSASIIVDKQLLTDSVLFGGKKDPFPILSGDDFLIGHRLSVATPVTSSVFFEENISNTFAIRIINQLGTTTQDSSYDANIADAYKGTDFELNTTNPFCAGNCYLYTTSRYHPNVFSNIGIPEFQAKIKGKKCFDTRDSTTAWTQNPVLILYDYLTSEFYGLGVTSAEIDITTFDAAANVCDENVTITDQTTQLRYTCDLVLFMDQDHRSNIKNILATMAGSLIYTEGKYKVYAGAWSTPTLTINESWINGGISVVPKESKRNLFNTVKGLYVDTTSQDDYNEFPSITDTDYVTADNGEELMADLQFLGVTDVERAQRLAKIFLQRHRYSEVVTMTCNYNAMQLSVMDTVNFTNTILGYSAKTYRVIGWAFNQNGNGIDLTLRNEAAAVYTWTETEATIPSPATSLPLPDYNTVQLPGAPVITEEIYSTSDGAGVKVRAIVIFSGSLDAFINTYQIEYKLISGVGYTILGRTQSTRFVLADIKPGLYEFRVKAINSYGVSSDYSSSTKEIIGLSEAPADMTGFSINVINNNAHLSWDQATDLDVKIGGRILVKHTIETVSPNWSNSMEIIPSVSGKDTSAIAPLITGTYMIKAIDSTNNQCLNAVSLSVTIPNMTQLNVVTTQSEHTAFSGTKNNMAVIDSTLRLTSVDLWDDITDNWDDITDSWDIAGGNGINLTGDYEFSTYIDLGKVVTSRASIAIDWSQFEEGNLWDDITTNWDDITGLWDGENQSVLNLIPYIATTDDDPSGSPTWSSWNRFYIGDFNARGYKFKIEVTNAQKNFNLQVNTLSATIDMPDIVDSGSVSTSAGGDTTESLNATYYSIPNVTGTIVNGASGDYIAILNETATSFDVSVYNSSNARIVKTVVWMTKGY